MRAGVLVVVLAVTATLATAAPGGRLRGEVKRGPLHVVPGMTVVAVRAEAPSALAVTLTDRRGSFAFDGLPEGHWTVLGAEGGTVACRVSDVTIRGPFRAVADLEVRQRHEGRLAIDLAGGEGPCRLAVQVVDAAGRPMPGVGVELTPIGHRADPRAVRTGEDGRAAVGPLACGGWRIVVRRAGWITLVLPQVTWPAGEVPLLARMLPTDRETPAPLDELLPPAELIPPR